MKGGSAPTPPDPVATAAAQTKSNQDTAQYQQAMNLINQVTPNGSLTYAQTGIGPGGAPMWTATTSLTPEGQKSFDLQQQVGAALNNLALSGTQQVKDAMNKPLDYNNLPSLSGLDLSKLTNVSALDLSSLPKGPNGLDLSGLPDAPKADEAARQAASDALYKQATSRLDPQFDQQQKQLETQLVNSGVARGSDAWNNAMSQFGRQKTDAYDTAQRSAIAGATDYELGQFNMANTAYGTGLNTAQAKFSADQSVRQNAVAEALDKLNADSQLRSQQLGEQQAVSTNNLQNRQQGITESNYLRELPINEISALMNGGQVQQPQFTNTPQTQVTPTNTAQIAQNSFQDQMQVYQQKQQANQALLGGIFGLGSAALGGWATGGFK